MNSLKLLLSVLNKAKAYKVRGGYEMAVPLADIQGAIDSALIERKESFDNTQEGTIVT